MSRLSLSPLYTLYSVLTTFCENSEPGTGRSRGFGFVTFAEQSSADQAIQSMNDQELVRLFFPVLPLLCTRRRSTQASLRERFGFCSCGLSPFLSPVGSFRSARYDPATTTPSNTSRCDWVSDCSPCLFSPHLFPYRPSFRTLLPSRRASCTVCRVPSLPRALVAASHVESDNRLDLGLVSSSELRDLSMILLHSSLPLGTASYRVRCLSSPPSVEPELTFLIDFTCSDGRRLRVNIANQRTGGGGGGGGYGGGGQGGYGGGCSS